MCLGQFRRWVEANVNKFIGISHPHIYWYIYVMSLIKFYKCLLANVFIFLSLCFFSPNLTSALYLVHRLYVAFMLVCLFREFMRYLFYINENFCKFFFYFSFIACIFFTLFLLVWVLLHQTSNSKIKTVIHILEIFLHE